MSDKSKVLDVSELSMQEIMVLLKYKLKTTNSVHFSVVNPDICVNNYAGQQISVAGADVTCRPLRAWVDLAGLLMCRMNVPEYLDRDRVLIEFVKLEIKNSFHADSDSYSEKYGADSHFADISKGEEPTFLWAYLFALDSVDILHRRQVLNLGINSGDELSVIKRHVGNEFDNMEFVGIDYCKSAIELASDTLNEDNVNLICHDINELDALNIGKFDLIISIGTLQSTTINMKLLVMSLVQNYLSHGGAIILGFPSSRWLDGELVYGAMAPNYGYPELSLVIKDIYWVKKYLQQHKFRVTITGREYLFLTATKIGV